MRTFARNFLLIFSFAIAACASDETRVPRTDGNANVAHVSQASTDDGKAEAQYGQKDLVSNEARPPRIGLNAPAGLAIDPALGANQVFIADRGDHRALFVDDRTMTLSTGLIGQGSFDGALPNRGGPPSSIGLNGPRDVDSMFGQPLVADTSNHRVLLFFSPFGGAALVFGQLGRTDTNTPNSGGISARSLSSPSSVAALEARAFAVADAGNHRVLAFSSDGISDKAYEVLGQVDVFSSSPNRGGPVSAASLNDPRGVERTSPYVLGGVADPRVVGLYVVDRGNDRVLRFRRDAAFAASTPRHVTAADFVYGQPDFTSNAPGLGPSGLNAPTAIAIDPNGGVWIADTGNHRVLHFHYGKTSADRVLGQPDFDHGDPPTTTTESTLMSPEGLAVAQNGDLYVSDTGTNRILKYVFVATPASCDDGDPCTNDVVGPSGCIHDTSSSPECFPYGCDFATRTCAKDCTFGCQSPYLCFDGRCALNCTSGATCPRGFCVDHFCCDSECSGTCEACDAPGKEGFCTAISGLPRAGKKCESPDGSTECGGTCDGVRRDACRPAVQGARCGVVGCKDDVERLGGSCDGVGSCVPLVQACFPFACGASACRTSCVGDDECATGARCVDGACVERSKAFGSVGGSCATSPASAACASRSPIAIVSWVPWVVVAALGLAVRRKRGTT